MVTLENSNTIQDRNCKKNKQKLKWNYQTQVHGMCNNFQKLKMHKLNWMIEV